MSDDELRDDLPAEAYIAHADFVRIAFKEMTAHRMVGWLRDVADVYEMGGSDKSAEHTRAVANRLESELPDDKFGDVDE